MQANSKETEWPWGRECLSYIVVLTIMVIAEDFENKKAILFCLVFEKLSISQLQTMWTVPVTVWIIKTGYEHRFNLHTNLWRQLQYLTLLQKSLQCCVELTHGCTVQGLQIHQWGITRMFIEEPGLSVWDHFQHCFPSWIYLHLNSSVASIICRITLKVTVKHFHTIKNQSSVDLNNTIAFYFL